MKRTALTILAALGLLLSVAAPVSAAPGDGPGSTPPPHRHRTSVAVPLCVTTTWRAEHTHTPKTAPGEVCQVRVGMWIPSSWHRVGVVYSRDRSEAFEVWQRPW